MRLPELFCHVDDACQAFEPQWQQSLLQQGTIKRVRQAQLSTSEIKTIVIHFHQARYHDLKTYYTKYVLTHLCADFPPLVGYTLFVELMGRVVVPLIAYFYHCKGRCTGISFVDSTPSVVCHNRRISRHKVFDDLAAWFYGFELHLVVNDRGELLAVVLTPGNIDDRHPVPQLARELFGQLFGDKGYLSAPLAKQLLEHGIELITSVRRNMKNQLLPLVDKFLWRKRSIVETIHDQLKNISQIVFVSNFLGSVHHPHSNHFSMK